MRTALGVPVHPDARIHAGTWPGPRTSHYHFDLNRDWFTQSHPETRGRVQTMLRWWPHVAVDLHEMSYASTYFFPPPMAPINRLVDPGDPARVGRVRRGEHRRVRRARVGVLPPRGLRRVLSRLRQLVAHLRGRRGDDVRAGQQPRRRHPPPGRPRAHPARGGASTTTRQHGHARRRSPATARARVADYLAFRQAAVRGTSEDGIRAVAFERDAEGRADSLARRWRTTASRCGGRRVPRSCGGRSTADGRGERAAGGGDVRRRPRPAAGAPGPRAAGAGRAAGLRLHPRGAGAAARGAVGALLRRHGLGHAVRLSRPRLDPPRRAGVHGARAAPAAGRRAGRGPLRLRVRAGDGGGDEDAGGALSRQHPRVVRAARVPQRRRALRSRRVRRARPAGADGAARGRPAARGGDGRARGRAGLWRGGRGDGPGEQQRLSPAARRAWPCWRGRR